MFQFESARLQHVPVRECEAPAEPDSWVPNTQTARQSLALPGHPSREVTPLRHSAQQPARQNQVSYQPTFAHDNRDSLPEAYNLAIAHFGFVDASIGEKNNEEVSGTGFL